MSPEETCAVCEKETTEFNDDGMCEDCEFADAERRADLLHDMMKERD